MVIEYGPLYSVFFRYTNKLELILYSVVLYNLSQIDSEIFFFCQWFFFPQGFPRKILYFFFISYFFIMSLIIMMPHPKPYSTSRSCEILKYTEC